MPITKSAKKALRQSKKRRARNLKQSRSFKDEVKALKKTIASKDKKSALEGLPKVYKAVDKAVKTNILKKNTAARMKSQLAKEVNKL